MDTDAACLFHNAQDKTVVLAVVVHAICCGKQRVSLLPSMHDHFFKTCTAGGLLVISASSVSAQMTVYFSVDSQRSRTP